MFKSAWIVPTIFSFTSTKGTYLSSPTGLQINVGSASSGQGTAIQSSSHTEHGSFNAATRDYNIAYVVLSQALTYSSNIQPIALPDASYQLPDNTQATVSGFGGTSVLSQFSSSVLKYVNVPVQSSSTCNNYYPVMTSRMLCAGLVSGQQGPCPVRVMLFVSKF